MMDRNSKLQTSFAKKRFWLRMILPLAPDSSIDNVHDDSTNMATTEKAGSSAPIVDRLRLFCVFAVDHHRRGKRASASRLFHPEISANK
jgi:hypothetical protein